MTASQVRAEARSALKNKWKKGALITFCFFLIELLISFAISFLENFGSILGLIASIANIVLAVPLSCGFLYAFMKFVNGEDVKCFDFFELGFSNFKRFWCVTGNILLKIWPYLLGAFICMFLCTFLFSFGVMYSATGILSGSSSAGFSLFSMLLGFLAFGGYIALIVIGEIKALLYYLAYPLAIDKPELSAKETVNMSKDLMFGNRGKLFCLFLSFTGWVLLPWVPYLVFAVISALIRIPIVAIIFVIISLILLAIAYHFIATYIMSAFIVFYKKRVESLNQPVQENNQIEPNNTVE